MWVSSVRGESGRPYWPHDRLPSFRLQPVFILVVVPGTSFVAIPLSIFATPFIALARRYIGLADNVFGTVTNAGPAAERRVGTVNRTKHTQQNLNLVVINEEKEHKRLKINSITSGINMNCARIGRFVPIAFCGQARGVHS